MIDLDARTIATQALVDKWIGTPFEWGKGDCAKLAAAHLRANGHKVMIAKAGTYTTALGATRSLKRLGADTLADYLDTKLERLPAPAFALVGDIISFEGDHAIGAIGIVLGNGRVLAWHEDAAGLTIMQLHKAIAAWRV